MTKPYTTSALTEALVAKGFEMTRFTDGQPLSGQRFLGFARADGARVVCLDQTNVGMARVSSPKLSRPMLLTAVGLRKFVAQNV